ncbi:MAG: hypothetical protein ACRDDX_00785 [Cellulosilyticaceae bacterium]
MKQLFEKQGADAELVFLSEYPKKKSIQSLVQKIEAVDMVGFIFPLYVDIIYSPNVEVMEVLHDSYKEKLKGKSIFGIGQCGFLDITRCEPIVDYLRYFAAACGMKWCGGLGYGGAPRINGTYLENFGKTGRQLLIGFSQAVDELMVGGMISQDTQDIIEEKVPRILYRPLTLMLSHMNRKKGKALGITNLIDPVYLEK